MKKLLFGLVATIMLSFTGNAQTDVNEISKKISIDPDFIELVNVLEKYSETPTVKNVVNFSKDKALSENERELLLKQLGFNSVEEAYDFDMNNYSLLEKIYKKHQLSSFDTETLNSIYNNAINMRLPSGGPNCKGRLSNCRLFAHGSYMVAMSGCVATGVGVGTLSFWCAGCVGWALGATCVTGATMGYDAMLDGCAYDYQECIN